MRAADTSTSGCVRRRHRRQEPRAGPSAPGRRRIPHPDRPRYVRAAGPYPLASVTVIPSTPCACRAERTRSRAWGLMTAVISFTAQSQTAPREADPTRRAYLCSTRACSAGAAGPIPRGGVAVHRRPPADPACARRCRCVPDHRLGRKRSARRRPPPAQRARRTVRWSPENRPSVISMTSCRVPRL